MINDRRDNSWKISKQINLSEIVSVLIIFITIVSFFFALDNKIAINSHDIEIIKEQRRQDTEQIQKRLDKIDDNISKIADKLYYGKTKNDVR